ncbi:neprilysin-2 isoform X2 [Diorhabda sublineata]|uniref:neprilysin-2 isoform X2 n=1 Tax=Diorhabda sublineata TaxID=1163346 RepID=UPI0024E0E427|nr:neprilysin-2 isoform X2 [Diorhabda sublineata]
MDEMTSSVKQTVIKNPTWWKRRTSMERCLTLSTGIAFLVGISLVIALATVLVSRNREITNRPYTAEPLQGKIITITSPDQVEEKVCLTPGCIHTASRVLEYMDENVDPCDDFYQFTCGNFIKKTIIPDDKSSVTSFTIIGDELQEQLRTMIEEPISEEEPKPFKLTKRLYQACMNKTLIEQEGMTRINQVLKELGGWPVLEGISWNENNFDWKESVYRFRRIGYGVDYFIDFSVVGDVKNSTRRIIDLDQASLGLRREFLIKGLDEKIVKAYYDYMVDLAVLFGAERERAAKELKASLDFEIQLAKISLPSEKRRNMTALYNPMTIQQLQKKFNSIPWVEYINNLLSPDTRVDSSEIVVVNVPSYLKAFETLISKTPKRVQANYVMWRAASNSVSYLTDRLRKRQLEYTSVITGKTEREPRWKECIDIAAGSLSIASGALYVRKYFNEEARQNALEMVKDIRTEFEHILKVVDWMDEETRTNALEKAKSMTTHIAYPDELLDDEKLKEFYDGLEIDSKHYFGSVLNLTLFGTRFSFKRLRQPVNKTDWITHGRPAVVNAFYSSIENSIQFPAGILQGVFFNSERPRYMNYGAIGFVIGHEITHGFDDQGRQFDKNGNLVDWWQETTKERFDEKAQCIIDQYANYTVPELNLQLNGINTQGENIADNGGIKEAYLAYNSWVKRHGQEPKLPGLKYTPNQMFWISAANSWCSKYRPESLKLRVLTGYHSPGRFRVLGPLRNSEYFRKDFKCPSGSNMNPNKKCTVW